MAAERHLCHACMVEVTWPKDNTPSAVDSASSSGILVDHYRGLVLTHASIILSYLATQKNLLHKLVSGKLQDESILKSLSARIVLEKLTPNNVNSTIPLPKIISQSATANHEEDYFSKQTWPAQIESYKGDLCALWKCGSLDAKLAKLFPKSDNWTFHSEPALTQTDKNKCLQDTSSKVPSNTDHVRHKNHNSDGSSPMSDAELNELAITLMPCFLLVQIKGWKPVTSQPSYLEGLSRRSNLVQRGQRLAIISTPFGSMSPAVFLNCLSTGVVCNTVGSNNELIFTDARCIPGAEGAPVYVDLHSPEASPVGIVLTPLCWKANEWIGLTIVSSLAEVVSSLPQLTSSGYAPSRPPTSIPAAERSTVLSNLPVVLVQSGATWGSGLIVHQGAALVITCGHVVGKRTQVQVKVTHHGRPQWYVADVLFTNKPGMVFDLAVLKVRELQLNPDWPSQVPTSNVCQHGEEVLVVGHAVFGQEHGLQPSVVAGVISKVIHCRGQQVMIQSTCAVHAGASGGPLVTEKGNIIGIVTCNARDMQTHACYPHINMSVPVSHIWPIVTQYLQKNDPKVFNDLCVNDPDVAALWNLKTTDSMETGPCQSKL